MGEMTMIQSKNDDGFVFGRGNVKKTVKISAEIPNHLHVVAKNMYAIQGKKMSERFEALIRSDLKRMLKTETFKGLPERDIAFFKAVIDSDMK